MVLSDYWKALLHQSSSNNTPIVDLKGTALLDDDGTLEVQARYSAELVRFMQMLLGISPKAILENMPVCRRLPCFNNALFNSLKNGRKVVLNLSQCKGSLCGWSIGGFCRRRLANLTKLLRQATLAIMEASSLHQSPLFCDARPLNIFCGRFKVMVQLLCITSGF